MDWGFTVGEAGGGTGRSGELGWGGGSGGPVLSPRGSSQESDEQRVAVLTGVDKDAPKSDTWSPENSLGNENNPRGRGVSKREGGV